MATKSDANQYMGVKPTRFSFVWKLLNHAGPSGKVKSYREHFTKFTNDVLDKEHKLVTMEEVLASPKKTHHISAFKGDDEVRATNSILLCAAAIFAAACILRIRISWCDTWIHHWWANYAEHEIFAPVTVFSDYETVNTLHKSKGTFMVPDNSTLKSLNPTRKGSNLGDDLASKYGRACRVASFTDRDQMAAWTQNIGLVIAWAVFDYHKSVESTILSKTEGGCGGHIPFNQNQTALAMLFYYRGGQTTRGTLQAMSEAIDINNGKLSPSSALALMAVHSAMNGSKAFLKKRELIEKGAEVLGSETKVRDFVRASMDVEIPLPPGMREKAIVITPNDNVFGLVTKWCRDKKLISTEIDLEVKFSAREQAKALLGIIPMAEIINNRDEFRAKYRSTSIKALTEISKWAVEPTHHLHEYVAGWPKLDSPEALDIIKRYMEMVQTGTNALTSLCYAGALRLYSQEVVQEFLGDPRAPGFSMSLLLADFPARAPSSQSILMTNKTKAIESRNALAWIRAMAGRTRPDFLCPPIGSSPDDIRIHSQCSTIISNMNKKENLVIVVITSDRSLTIALSRYERDFTQGGSVRLGIWPRGAYIGQCSAKPKPIPRRSIRIWNILKERHLFLPRERLADIQNCRATARNVRNQTAVVLYDIHNIERALGRVAQLKMGFSFGTQWTTTTGGFLTKEYRNESLTIAKSVFGLERKQLCNLPCFTVWPHTTSLRPGSIRPVRNMLGPAAPRHRFPTYGRPN